MKRNIRISGIGVPHDYRDSLIPIIAKCLGYQIIWVKPHNADLIIFGPFFESLAQNYRWCPKILRESISPLLENWPLFLRGRRFSPLTLFHTGENLRHDWIKADYSISFDLNINLSTHLRLPYWMEMVDWTSFGIVGNRNPRFGELFSPEKMQKPIIDLVERRNQSAVMVTSHMRGMRRECYEAISKIMPVNGFGSYFHNANQQFSKKKLLSEFAYNLCPENSTFPGYVTEKIPEAYLSGCIPITYIDDTTYQEFNELSYLNLFNKLHDDQYHNLFSQDHIKSLKEQPLLTKPPTINPAIKFINHVFQEAIS